MTIRVLFFGVVKDLVGRPNDTLVVSEGARVEEVLALYLKQTPRLRSLLPSLAFSVNQEYASADRVLADEDELGLLPPVSGGAADPPSGEDEIRIVREPITPQVVIAKLKCPEHGAVVAFEGIVRDNSRGRRTLRLDYEAHEPMAQKQMETLAEQARTRFGVSGVSIVHRLGCLQVGETSVLVAVASSHRAAAFDACRWIIDTLKKTVPIWKKEHFEDGAVWADGEPCPKEMHRHSGIATKEPHLT